MSAVAGPTHAMSLTRATPADAPALAALMDVAREGWPGFTPSDPAQVAHDLADPDEEVWLVGERREPDGALWLYRRADKLLALYPFVRTSAGAEVEGLLLDRLVEEVRGASDGMTRAPEARLEERQRLEQRGFVPARVFHRIILPGERLAGLQPRPLPHGARVEQPDPARYQRLHNAAFADHFGFSPVPLRTVQHWYAEPGFDSRDWQVLVVQGEDVAYASVGVEDGTGWVHQLGVPPQFQRRGFGRLLLEHACGGLRERGAREVHLGVDTENVHGALGFYESVGFESAFATIAYRLA